MNVASLKPRMDVPEFLAWGEQPQGKGYELVDGEIIAMSLERARHNLAKFEAALALREGIRAAQLACTVFTDGMTIVIDEKHRLGHTARIIASAARSSDTDAMMNAAVRIFAPVVLGEEDR